MPGLSRRILGIAAVCAVWLAGVAPLRAQSQITVFAAASMTQALGEIAALWTTQGNPAPRLVFGSSAALARQIDEGAPAQVFVSADESWMDLLVAHGLVQADTRADIAGNSLVMVGPHGAPPLSLTPAALTQRLGAQGRLAMADPDAVPAGRYGAAALKALGLWDSVSTRLAPAADVRACLLLVERGEAPLGIVYATDARLSTAASVVASFPESSHMPIRYPVAALTGAGLMREGAAFARFMVTPAAQAVLRKYGFTAP